MKRVSFTSPPEIKWPPVLFLKTNMTGIHSGPTQAKSSEMLNFQSIQATLAIICNWSGNHGDQDRPLYWFLLNTSANVPLTRYKNWRTDKYSTPSGYYNGYYENPYHCIDTNRDEHWTNRLNATYRWFGISCPG